METDGALERFDCARHLDRSAVFLAESNILVDVGLTCDATDDVMLNAAVYNLFDKEVDAAEFGTVREGRSVWFGATARF